jgi:hypothetical protein
VSKFAFRTSNPLDKLPRRKQLGVNAKRFHYHADSAHIQRPEYHGSQTIV